MEGSKIRETFLSFFEARGHTRVRSSSLVAPPETGLLLTTAGMVQFIPYFLGREAPPYSRATSVQKSFRTTDIENVGHTARHLTLFEMLGNFSFGDYFKSEACRWAFELVTEAFAVDPGRLWVTIFESDDEAADIWADEVGIPRDRIVRRGRDDNFWWTHAAGPGGPCSEIFVDRGPKYGPEGGPAVDEERFLEIWNLVFMQNEMDDEGNVVGDLPKKNIDTGSSLERVAVVLQDVDSVFETDLLRPLLETAEGLAGRRYGEDERSDVSLRILAEHGRATTFLIADGVLPSNEGRGYVLRRMLRRLVTHARRLDVAESVTGPLVERTVEMLGDAYPELAENREFILQVSASEEDRFGVTLRQGLTILEDEMERSRRSGLLPGDVAFKLHDTHGFNVELIRELAEEQGLRIDEDGFDALMQEQRDRAHRAMHRGGEDEAIPTELAGRLERSEFLGYEQLVANARVDGLVEDGREVEAAQEGEDVRVVLSRTPFYAEAGGQIGDRGVLRTPRGVVRITDTQHGPRGLIVHHGHAESGEVRVGDEVHAEVDAARRESTARSHTATHVVHWTLRHLLGEHARQAGSLVEPGRLRFDFTHHSALPTETLEEMEYTANRRLAEDSAVRAYETTMDYARSQGAIALFDEKYGDLVRVVEIGDYSRELCGGTHVPHTGKVALVRLLGEGSIGSGLRRIEALVGPDALRHVNEERRLLEDLVDALGGGDPRTAPDRLRKVMERIKQLESELGKIRREDQSAEIDRLISAGIDVDGVRVLVDSKAADTSALREMAIQVRNRLAGEPAVVVLTGSGGGKTSVVAAVTKSLVQRGLTAAEIAQPVAVAAGGNAGGKPDLAIGGGPRPIPAEEVPILVQTRLRELLGTG